jgi:hypothetical protein
MEGVACKELYQRLLTGLGTTTATYATSGRRMKSVMEAIDENTKSY